MKDRLAAMRELQGDEDPAEPSGVQRPGERVQQDDVAATGRSREVDDEEDEIEEEEVAEAEEEEPGDWITDDVRAVARSYGMTDDDLAEIPDFNTFRLIGRQLNLQATRYYQQGAQPQQPPQEQPPQAAPQPPAAEQPAEETPGAESEKPWLDGKKLNPEYYEKEGYEDPTTDVTKTVRSMQDEMDLMWNFFAQKEAERRRDEFHDTLDEMDPDFFGVSRDEHGQPINVSDEQASRRERMMEQASVLENALRQQDELAGREPQNIPFKTLCDRAYTLAYGERQREAESKQRQSKLQGQSKTRRRVARQSRNMNPPPKAPTRELTVEEIANHPDVVASWNRGLEEAGNY